jgi:hypothetical protein
LKDGGCYAKGGPLRLVWERVDKHGVDFDQFLREVQALPRRQLWRYGQAGDLPPNREDVLALARANAGRPVIAYTHGRDLNTLRDAAALGFHVNLSSDSLAEADELVKMGLPVVIVLPTFYQKLEDETLRAFRNRIGGKLRLETPGGNQVAICPATYADTTCSVCQVCAKPRAGGTIIGFPAHGNQKRRIDARMEAQVGALNAYHNRSATAAAGVLRAAGDG